MKRLLALATCLVAFIGTGSSFAVSDGHYDPRRQHCAGSDDNSDNAKHVGADCKNFIFTISDVKGHEYVGAGFRQTADGEFVSTGDVWIDPGQGQKATFTMSQDGPGAPTMVPGDRNADPSSGLRVYFGADDNLDVGEHDSSQYVNNGPSDGGGVEINVDPSTAGAWVSALQAADAATLLENPTPIASAGAGACADGFCMSITSHRRVAFRGGDQSKHRDVANYVYNDGSLQNWDPYDCAGPDDEAVNPKTGQFVCGTKDHPSWTLQDWVNQNGTVYVEPGIQIYEDPDPQGSPGVIDTAITLIGNIPAVYEQQDPYPLPSLYIGACGIVFGGGPVQVPTGPLTNAAGQLVVPTACN